MPTPRRRFETEEERRLAEVERCRARRRRLAAAEGREVRAWTHHGHEGTPYHQKPGARAKRTQYKREVRARQAMEQGRKPRRNSSHALHEAHVEAWNARLKRAATNPHTAHVNLWRKERSADWYTHRYRTNPEFNASEKLRTQLRKLKHLDADLSAHMAEEAKRGGFRKTWPALLGYDGAQLVRHLRRTLPAGATWQDFMDGALHIDHIRPRALYDLTSPDEVKRCWCLSNLRLLGATDNMRKGAKVEALL